MDRRDRSRDRTTRRQTRLPIGPARHGGPAPAPLRLVGLAVFVVGFLGLPDIAREAPFPLFVAAGIVTGVGLLVAAG